MTTIVANYNGDSDLMGVAMGNSTGVTHGHDHSRDPNSPRLLDYIPEMMPESMVTSSVTVDDSLIRDITMLSYHDCHAYYSVRSRRALILLWRR